MAMVKAKVLFGHALALHARRDAASRESHLHLVEFHAACILVVHVYNSCALLVAQTLTSGVRMLITAFLLMYSVLWCALVAVLYGQGRLRVKSARRPDAWSDLGLDQRSAALEQDWEQDCCICLSHLAVGEVVTTMACGHAFHRDCLLPWLLSNRRC